MDIINELLKRQDHIYNYCLKLCHNLELAEDLKQDTNLKILKKKDLYSEALGEFHSWALRIAYNTYIDYLRKHKQGIVTCFSDNTYQNINGSYFDKNVSHSESNQKTDDPIIEKELRCHINKMISKMNNREAISFKKYSEGYSHREIATELEVNNISVRVYVHRARMVLKESLKDVYADNYRNKKYCRPKKLAA